MNLILIQSLILLTIVSGSIISFLNLKSGYDQQISASIIKVTAHLLQQRMELYLTDANSVKMTAEHSAAISACLAVQLEDSCYKTQQECISNIPVCIEANTVCNDFDACVDEAQTNPLKNCNDKKSLCNAKRDLCKPEQASCNTTFNECETASGTGTCEALADQDFTIYNSADEAIAGDDIYYDYVGERCTTPSSTCMFTIKPQYSTTCPGGGSSCVAADTIVVNVKILQADVGIKPLSGIQFNPDSIPTRHIPLGPLPAYSTISETAGSNLGKKMYCAINGTMAAKGSCAVNYDTNTKEWTRTGSCRVGCLDFQ